MSPTTAKERIFVAGHRGMVGSALVRQLQQRDGVEIVTRARDKKSGPVPVCSAHRS